MVEKSLEEETLALALQENMQLGLFMITVSDVWCLAFADIFRNNCLNVGVPFRLALHLLIKYSKLL
jgi:3-isopropylmalate dehydratase small subunit